MRRNHSAYRECSSSSSCAEAPNTNFVHSLPHNLEKLETRLPLFCAELHIDVVFHPLLNVQQKFRVVLQLALKLHRLEVGVKLQDNVLAAASDKKVP